MTFKKREQQLSLLDFLSSDELEDNSFINDTPKHGEEDSSWHRRTKRISFPTELVVDFDIFLDYLRQQQVKLTKKRGYISNKHLPTINKKLSLLSEDVAEHAQQEQYSYIHFFYYIALAGKLIRKESMDSNNPYLVVTERLNLYQRLTDVEKYFFILETFWVDVNYADVLSQPKNPVCPIITDFYNKLIKQDCNTPFQLKYKEPLLYRLTLDWNYFFVYLEWLGFWICEKDSEHENQAKSKFYVTYLQLTPFGEKMMPILFNERHPDLWNIPFRQENGDVNPIPGFVSSLESPIRQANHSNQSSAHVFHKAFTQLFPRALHQSLPRDQRDYIPGV